MSNFNKSLSILFWLFAGISLIITIGTVFMLLAFSGDSPLTRDPLGTFLTLSLVLLIGLIPSLLLGMIAHFVSKGSKIAIILGGILLIAILLLLFLNITGV